MFHGFDPNVREVDGNYGPWFPIGSRVEFTGKGGHRHEREQALLTFTLGELYTVVASRTYDSTSDVTLAGFEETGRWNTVLFEAVEGVA
jgi:hypothetical protein